MRRLPNMSREVASKSEAAIERETALKWAGRAVACYRKHHATGKTSWLVRAHDYRHEALEHAATVGDHGKTVRDVQRAIEAVEQPRTHRRSRARQRRRSTMTNRRA